MLTYSTHRPPTFATIGAHVELGRAQPGRCGAASVGGIQCTRSGDALTCTLRPFALVANAYQRPSPHTMLGSGKSVPMAACRNDWGGGPPLGGSVCGGGVTGAATVIGAFGSSVVRGPDAARTASLSSELPPRSGVTRSCSSAGGTQCRPLPAARASPRATSTRRSADAHNATQFGSRHRIVERVPARRDRRFAAWLATAVSRLPRGGARVLERGQLGLHLVPREDVALGDAHALAFGLHVHLRPAEEDGEDEAPQEEP